jgi:hypothetical protein
MIRVAGKAGWGEYWGYHVDIMCTRCLFTHRNFSAASALLWTSWHRRPNIPMVRESGEVCFPLNGIVPSDRARGFWGGTSEVGLRGNA